MIKWMTLFGALLASFVAHADENPLAGTWRLVSVSTTSADGTVGSEPYGPEPHGYITYTRGGHMTVILSFRDRPLLHGSWRSAPEHERAAAFATVLAYAGQYTIKGSIVTHHIDVATDPNRVGKSLNRTFVLDRDKVTLSTPPLNLGDSAKVYSLVWQRIEP